MTRLEGVGSKQRWLRRFWVVIIALSLATGLAAGWINGHTGDAVHLSLLHSLFSEAPISQVVAILFLAMLALTMIGSMYYYRAIDEHDRGAQEYASLVGLNLYVFLFFGWSIAGKGSLVQPINHSAVFVTVVGTFIVSWLWRRYR